MKRTGSNSSVTSNVSVPLNWQATGKINLKNNAQRQTKPLVKHVPTSPPIQLSSKNVVSGKHSIQGKGAFVRCVGANVMVRTGGGWTHFRDWLEQTFDADNDFDLAPILFGNDKRRDPSQKITIAQVIDSKSLNIK